MIDAKVYLETISKYGVRGLMVLALIWMNNRLNTVEDKLYDCFDDKEDILKSRVSNESKPSYYIKPYMVAVLPNKCYEIKEDNENIAC